MERLTIPDVRVDEHTTRRTMIDGEAVREHAMDFYWRLKAYEDTGLTPKEFAAYWVFIQDLIGDQKASEALSHLLHLAQADKDGRLVVLPCKVGQRVFALLDTDKHISECEVKRISMGNKIGFIGLEPIGARGREYGISLNGFGKTVFRTREEAEKALEAMKDG
jgi:hypothetical protein